jgi:hypothetical protein
MEYASMNRSLFTLLLLTVVSNSGFGSPLITFSTPASQKVTTGGGQISYVGGANPLVGSNILISSITAGSSTVACTGCLLNFTTGNLLSQTTLGSSRTWVFDGGAQQLGQFTITGRVSAAGITTNTTLLTGYFSSPTLSLTGVLGTTPRYRLFSGSLVDVKNATLVDFLLGSGYTYTYGNTFSGSYTQSFVDNLTRPRQIPILSDALLAGTVANDQVVPEPSSLILFTSAGLVVGVAVVRRRRLASGAGARQSAV